MTHKDPIKSLSAEDENLNLRIFDLVVSRVFKRVFLGLDEVGRKNMERIFITGEDKEREKFSKKNIPNLKKILKEEAKKIEEEIKSEIEKHILQL